MQLTWVTLKLRSGALIMGPLGGMKMGSDGPQNFFGGPGHYFRDRGDMR